MLLGFKSLRREQRRQWALPGRWLVRDAAARAPEGTSHPSSSVCRHATAPLQAHLCIIRRSCMCRSASHTWGGVMKRMRTGSGAPRARGPQPCERAALPGPLSTCWNCVQTCSSPKGWPASALDLISWPRSPASAHSSTITSSLSARKYRKHLTMLRCCGTQCSPQAMAAALRWAQRLACGLHGVSHSRIAPLRFEGFSLP
jgi:hypothetical protein